MLITNPIELKRFYTCHRVWQGIPGIAHTPGGRTFISFYSGGVAEDYGNFAAVIRSDDETNFTEPVAVALKEGEYRCFDPVLWLDPLGRLWFIWNVMPGEEVFASVCEDPDAETLSWSEEFQIGRGIMMNKPLVCGGGEWLFPIAIWRKDIYSEMREKGMKPEDVAGAYLYKTCDCGKTFTRLGFVDMPHRTFDEHMVYEQKDATLRMLVRLEKGQEKGIGESYSADGGLTWSDGVPVMEGPSSRFFIQKLPSGRVLFINHHNFTGRNNLTAFLSEDDGKTFPYSLLLDERKSVSYPDAQLCADGFIRITYDRQRGCFKSSMEEVYTFAREILVAKITEEDILAGKLVTEGSELQKVVSKLGELAPEDGDPFRQAK
ncbi:MAG: exo-alpha-sialidase [Ruminococcaceae bacterium]|nr:exo-alpha-sialidase [Oscillospiraceae bacterium]